MRARSQSRLHALPVTDSQPSLTGQFRDRIAVRSRRADVEFPKALDLEARVLEALHGALHGVASALSGTHSADHFRERLRGERTFPLGDLCRLATEPTREARAATLGALEEIAHAINYSLTPISEERRSLVDQVIAANEAAVGAHALVTRAYADGALSTQEAAGICDAATQLRRLAAGLEGVALAAKGGSEQR